MKKNESGDGSKEEKSRGWSRDGGDTGQKWRVQGRGRKQTRQEKDREEKRRRVGWKRSEKDREEERTGEGGGSRDAGEKGHERRGEKNGMCGEDKKVEGDVEERVGEEGSCRKYMYVFSIEEIDV